MNNCIFTIVAKNYIGLAQILESSIKALHSDIDFYIFVADTFDNKQEVLPENIIIAKNHLDYTSEQWVDMSFKYDLTEFCTAIKPSCFQYIFSKGYQKAIYLDPDIYVYSCMDFIFDTLNTYHIGLTPQIVGTHIHYQGEHPEWAMNVNGIFNLGFCAIKNSTESLKILEWWKIRLIDNCFIDRSTGNFTDQKWIDWLPALLGNDKLYVFRNIGMNMAPWNFFERQLKLVNNQIIVKDRTNNSSTEETPLVFLHFAGYDYQQMKKGIISRKRIEDLKEYDDLHLATEIYKDAIVQHQATFDKYISHQYTYHAYDNGQKIDAFHRRLYHGFCAEGKLYPNPFATNKTSFYQHLEQKGMINKENIDKLTQRNLPNINKKRKQIGLLFSLLFRLMGYKRYVLFVKSLYNYCRPELHTFLIKKK